MSSACRVVSSVSITRIGSLSSMTHRQSMLTTRRDLAQRAFHSSIVRHRSMRKVQLTQDCVASWSVVVRSSLRATHASLMLHYAIHHDHHKFEMNAEHSEHTISEMQLDVKHDVRRQKKTLDLPLPTEPAMLQRRSAPTWTRRHRKSRLRTLLPVGITPVRGSNSTLQEATWDRNGEP